MSDAIDIEGLNVAFNKLLHKFYDLSDENQNLKLQIDKLKADNNDMLAKSANVNKLPSDDNLNILDDVVDKAPILQNSNSNIENDTLNTTKNKDDYSSEDMDRIRNLIDSFK